MTQPAPARTSLLAGLVAVLAGIVLLVSLDLDISPHRYLRNDVLFRGASSIEAIYSYPTMDPCGGSRRRSLPTRPRAPSCS